MSPFNHRPWEAHTGGAVTIVRFRKEQPSPEIGRGKYNPHRVHDDGFDNLFSCFSKLAMSRFFFLIKTSRGNSL